MVTWNVNGLRARLPRVLGLLDDLEPDVVCVQESKCTSEQLPSGPLEQAGYQVIDHSSGRWNGVVILARQNLEVTDVVCGLDGEPMPDEARWVEATVDGTRVVSVYVPNGARSLPEKLEFLDAAAARTAVLVQQGPLVVVGDVNVAATDLDAAAPFLDAPTHVTPPERAALQKIVDSAGLVDTYRHQHPDRQAFTWWDYRMGAFRRNLGMRLDYALASRELDVARCDVAMAYRRETDAGKPSDHAPLLLNFTRGS